MRVTLGTFARSGIESQLGTDLTETVETAISHYTGKLTSGGRPCRILNFWYRYLTRFWYTHLRRRTSSREIELTLDSQTEAC